MSSLQLLVLSNSCLKLRAIFDENKMIENKEDLNWRCINTIRVLAAEMVQKANSGHPGAPMGCAPMAHVLFGKHLKFDPKNPDWISRDRFVLSNGHGCALQYILLHLCGYKLSMDDLKAFRQLDSKTPGHPENFITEGIEVTTGPLGQGVSNAVGLAIAESNLAANFNRPGFNIVDNYTYVIVGDGCLQEGISAEALSLAAHLGLGKLIVFYDDNSITIDGETDISFTENVAARMEAYGFHVQRLTNGDHDLSAISKAIEKAKSMQDKPHFIQIRTTIGFGSQFQGTEKVHGAPLGADEVIAVKKKFGFKETESFNVEKNVYDFYHQAASNCHSQYQEWLRAFNEYSKQYPDLAADLKRRLNHKILPCLKDMLPTYTPSDAACATRKLSEMLLNSIGAQMTELIGGSADLTASNLTRWKGAVDYQKSGSAHGNPTGRYIRYGVREHGMAAISNGIAAYGAFIPFCATFLNFIGYAQGALRLSALSHLKVVYIMTHDSIGLGEDGPTHQPVEILPLLRSTPNLLVLRPADGNEVSGAYYAALSVPNRPSVICLSRQNLPHLQGSSIEATLKGGYILQDYSKTPKALLDVILVSTGSEVSICVEAAQILAAEKNVRVVSMPSFELFRAQPTAYKAEVFPDGVPVLSVEASSTFGWREWAHASVGMTSFGASGPYKQVYEKFGLTASNVAFKAKGLMAFYDGRNVESLVDRFQ